MNVFELSGDVGSNYCVNGVWCLTQSRFYDEVSDKWIPALETKLLDGKNITVESRAEYLSRWYVLNSDTLVQSYFILGDFSKLRLSFPLFSASLKKIFESVIPDGFEYIEIEKVWAEKQACPIPGGPFYLANLLVERDTWDDELTEIYPMTRVDGTRYESIDGTKKFVQKSKLHGATIWRECRTNHVLCTQEVKDILQKAGVQGIHFQSVRVSDK
ncbi:imm11 family protein [Roseibium sp. TrichSKD4]|uniref:imm11 family protein n=1 Tax=Roseibium sp. TrichSKD4 TaxID=744980 RepID=UPI00058C6DEE|nr:DUF1629 domain-containing protein [Roseibium sp. TrichSKD4]